MFKLIGLYLVLLAFLNQLYVQAMPTKDLVVRKELSKPSQAYGRINVTWYDNDFCGGPGHAKITTPWFEMFCNTADHFCLTEPGEKPCPVPTAYKSIKFEEAHPHGKGPKPPKKPVFNLFYLPKPYDYGAGGCPGVFATQHGYGCVTTPAYASDGSKVPRISAWNTYNGGID